MATTRPARNGRSLDAFVSETAHERWHEFAAYNGVTVGAMLEALSELLTMHDNRTANSLLSEAVKAARLTDARRRRR